MKKIKKFSHLLLTLVLVLSMTLVPIAAKDNKQSIDLNCGSCLLVNMDNDTVLHGEQNTETIYPASTTKILTALVVLDHISAGDLSLWDTVTVSETFRKGLTYDAASGGIQSGEKLTIENLLYMLLLPSHCDAANVLAEATSGSLKDFAKEMNATAERLGCTNSHFVNPSGLHDDDHYTTCDDLYRIAKAAYAYDTFRTITTTDYYTVPATNLHNARKLHNTNALICDSSTTAYLNRWCTGGKTGTTFPAGRCLVSFAEQDGVTLCCVMMGCEYLINADGSRRLLQFYETNRLYDWAFDGEQKCSLVKKGLEQGSVTVSNGREQTVVAETADSLRATLPNLLTKEDLTYDVSLPTSVEAPITAGDKLGTLTVSYGDTVYGTVDLLAAESVDGLPNILSRLPQLKHEPRSASPAFVLIPIALLVALLAALGGFLAHRRKKSYISH